MRKSKVLNFIIASALLCAFIVTVWIVCMGDSGESYLPNAYTEDEVKALFSEHEDLFLKLPKILETEAFWEKGRPSPVATSASIVSPFDDNKLSLFTEDDRNTIIKIFGTIKPYMIALKYQEYLEVTFINEDRTSAYVIFYQYGWSASDYYPLITPESNIVNKVNSSRYKYTDLDNGWGFYYFLGYDTENTYSENIGSQTEGVEG